MRAKKFTAPKVTKAVKQIYKQLKSADPNNFVKNPMLEVKQGNLHYTTLSEPKTNYTFYTIERLGETLSQRLPDGKIKLTEEGSILTEDGASIFTAFTKPKGGHLFGGR